VHRIEMVRGILDVVEYLFYFYYVLRTNYSITWWPSQRRVWTSVKCIVYEILVYNITTEFSVYKLSFIRNEMLIHFTLIQFHTDLLSND
jgi:hypothetical protein